MLIPHDTVIALVDGETFELFRNSGSLSDPELSPLETPELPVVGKGSGARHYVSVGNPQPHHELAEDAHAAAVTDWLNHQAITGKLDKLIIAADPRMLGEMRRRYHVKLQEALVTDLAKNLIGRTGPEVLASLQD